MITQPDKESVNNLEIRLREKKKEGKKLLVCYITGGLNSHWLDTLHAVADAGADAIEIGIPFSDPVMDGPVIQKASMEALKNGATPFSILTQLSKTDAGVPLAVMTYYNLVYRMGEERFAEQLLKSGVTGAILPDLPLDEADNWIKVGESSGLATVLLAAPTTRDQRLLDIVAKSRGFVYAVGLLGVTGEREELSESATVLASRLKSHTDKPVLVGVGISNPAQAKAVCQTADGVVVGSALVRRILESENLLAITEFVKGLRESLDNS
jgi:tryptophan synthase alpha chain